MYQRYIAKGAEPAAGAVVESFKRLKDDARRPWRLLQWRQRHALFVADLDWVQNPAVTMWLYLAVSAGRGVIVDLHGRQRALGPAAGLRAGLHWLRDFSGAVRWRRFATQVVALPSSTNTRLFSRRAVFLRSDFARGVCVGGSISHIAGVVNHLPREDGMPVLITGETVPTVNRAIPQVQVPPARRCWDLADALAISYSLPLAAAVTAAAGAGAGFLYQRTSRSSIAGLIAARHCRLPLVSEYNGSDVWIDRQWGGRRTSWSALAERIELANLQASLAIVVVSTPLRDELVGRGIPPERILVNPNGVDPDRYNPAVDGQAVRMRLGIAADAVVVGFIGTFGPWHGAEVLARAWAACAAAQPTARLVFIGDGARGPATRQILADAPAGTWRWVGLVPQREGPAHLAACDILVNATVPNPDGSPFFGSPTKLFEYLAMGRAIVSSDLDQMGEILAHERTALLVPPGDGAALSAAILRLIDDPALRAHMGSAARAQAVARHSWRAHTDRIVDFLLQSRAPATGVATDPATWAVPETRDPRP